jgi:hypothetical protein
LSAQVVECAPEIFCHGYSSDVAYGFIGGSSMVVVNTQEEVRYFVSTNEGDYFILVDVSNMRKS